MEAAIGESDDVVLLVGGLALHAGVGDEHPAIERGSLGFGKRNGEHRHGEHRQRQRIGEQAQVHAGLLAGMAGHQGRASRTRLKGVSVGAAEAREAGLRRRTSRSRASPACAPSAARPPGQRGRRADQRRGRVEDAADRVEVVLDAVVRERLDDHPGAVRRERLAHVPRRADRVAHVVQAVEERHEVVAGARVSLRRRDLEADAVATPAARARARAPLDRRAW